jgi:uncharacterized repeat protein (TIGR01451 family)
MLLGSATAVATFTTASPAAAQVAAGAYGGTAGGNIVAVSAVNVPGTLQVANVAVAPTNAAVSSTGGIPNAASKTSDSYARAANLDAQLVNGMIPLNNLIVSASQSAPPDNLTAKTANLLSVPADPLLNATVANASANARWLGAQCVPVGTDISHATSTLATANVLTGTPVASGAVVSVVNGSGGPVTSDSAIGLVNVAGQANEGVASTQADQITGVVLFKGSAMELTINVLAPPKITAIATGKPGTASVAYTEPVLQIVQGGKIVATLDAKTANTSFTIPALATISIGKLTSSVAADGTSATGSASLLEIAIGVSPLPLNVATVEIAPSTVTAKVPSGGVYCPPATNPLSEFHKDASAAQVGPGQEFNYTVSVPNRGSCPLVSVVVKDTVTAPAGTTFVSSVPAPTSNNSTSTGFSFVYDLPTLQPNETVNIQITLRAPANLVNGAPFSNTASVSGLCQGAAPNTPPFTATSTINAPTGFVPGFNGCHLDDSNKAADHTKVFVGETFNYYIHVFNDGNQSCSGVTITDKVPANTTFVSATDGGTLSGNIVTWHLGTLGSGGSRSVVLQVKANPVPANTTLPNVAVISSSSEHPITVTAGGPAVTGISVLAAPNLPTSGANHGGGPLPVTGGQPLAPYGLGMLIAGFVFWGWRRRAHGCASLDPEKQWRVRS